MLEDGYLYPRDSAADRTSTDAIIRMSVESLDGMAQVSQHSQMHSNLAFVTIPEHGPSDSAFAAGPRRHSFGRQPFSQSDGTSRINSTSASAHGSVGSLPGLIASSFQPKQSSYVHFHVHPSANAAEFNSAAAANPKCLDGPDRSASGVQLRSKSSLRRMENRERSNVYEELPWYEQDGLRDAGAGVTAIGPDSGSNPRKRDNPLYGLRSSQDPLPSTKQDATTVSPRLTDADLHRLKKKCCILTAAVAVVAVIAVAALVIAAILAYACLPSGGGIADKSPGSLDASGPSLMNRILTLQTQVAALEDALSKQQARLSEQAANLNVTAAAFTKCSIRITQSVQSPVTEWVPAVEAGRQATEVVIGATCSSGDLTYTEMRIPQGRQYQCKCLGTTTPCVMTYWVCPARLF